MASSTLSKKPPETDWALRRATLADVPQMASIAATSYLDSPITTFLSPMAFTYMRDNIYSFERRIRGRMGDARNISVVAAESASGLVIGYGQFARFGSDAGAAAQQAAGAPPYWLRAYVAAREWWDARTFVDRSCDMEFLQRLLESEGGYWDEPEYANRWHTQSVAVSPRHQRIGVGRALMRVVLERAEAEGVCVGLEASPDGAKLYRALGFRLKADFRLQLEGGEGSGIFVWEPPRWQRGGASDV